MPLLLNHLQTYWRLGLINLARVGFYRLALKTGLHPVLKAKGEKALGPFYRLPASPATELETSTRWERQAEFFGVHKAPLPQIPDWHANALEPRLRAEGTRSWHEIPDFALAVGDIKCVWEYSRLGWILPMAQRASRGSQADLDRINLWLQDWCDQNEPYLGANWKCGQEASIRVMHLAAAAIILDQASAPCDGLIALIRTHLSRIAPAISYALGQQNNHATSEAAALFIGGSWLCLNGCEEGRKWERLGRKLLEVCAKKLISEDGMFSQYSTVYHRVVLDTYSIVEVWRRTFSLAPFSRTLVNRIGAAVRLMRELTDFETGDAPNMGANDGAHLLHLTDQPFRDFRPSVQLASVLYCGARAYPENKYLDDPLRWLNIDIPGACLPELNSASLDHGGLHILKRGSARAYFRYPRFRFRPSHCDIMHIDLWVEGKNLLRDGGSYSYNAPNEEGNYFSGSEGHNGVMFDGRDQMERISRFLFGGWLRTFNRTLVWQDADRTVASAAYIDAKGARHDRRIVLKHDELECLDELSGKAIEAILRWRLPAAEWTLQGNELIGKDVRIQINSESGNLNLRLSNGYESRHYWEKSEIPVLEVQTLVPARITTHFMF